MELIMSELKAISLISGLFASLLIAFVFSYYAKRNPGRSVVVPHLVCQLLLTAVGVGVLVKL